MTTSVPCRRCGVLVGLSPSALEQIATLDRILASRGETFLDDREVTSCRPCMLADRAEQERQSQAAFALARRIGDEVRAGRMVSPEEMRAAKSSHWWCIVADAIKAFSDEAKAKQQQSQERRPRRQHTYADRRAGS